MNSQISALMHRMQELEGLLETELSKRRAELHYGLEHGRAVFEEEILRRHKEMRTSLARYVLKARLLVVITAPFIYVLIVPLILLDLFVSIYQAVCFPVYGIKKVRRSDHIVFDRQHLAYLNALEMLNCAYCSYANGFFSYLREIGARTELHWCPIKHARRTIGAHSKYAQFVDYGDADAYQARLEEMRKESEPEGK